MVPILTADSSTTTEDLNPLIERFLLRCRAPIRAIGGHSALLVSPEGITAKIFFQVGDHRAQVEQDAFGLIQSSQSRSPYIAQCFLSRPDITFMPFISDKNLHNHVAMVNRPPPVFTWMFQLSSAATVLETIGLAHGDIKPHNILVDERDNLTLIDLDHTLPIGSDLEVGDEPYVRAHTLGESGECTA